LRWHTGIRPEDISALVRDLVLRHGGHGEAGRAGCLCTLLPAGWPRPQRQGLLTHAARAGRPVPVRDLWRQACGMRCPTRDAEHSLLGFTVTLVP